MNPNTSTLPNNLPDGSRAPPSTVDTGIELTNTVIAIIKEVGEMLSGFPYVKSLSGVILQIIKVRNELNHNKQRCGEIIDKVLRMAKSIYEKLDKIARSPQREKLAEIAGYLNEHERALTVIYGALRRNKSRPLFDRLINRGEDELDEHDRRLDELKTDTILNIIFNISIEQAVASSVPPASNALNSPSHNGPEHVLPPNPSIMVEREAQIDQALEILLRAEPSRVAILGGGGFGKTTLARSLLHDPNVVERYRSRYFLSCEGMPNFDHFLLGLGTMLELKVAPSAILASARRMLQMSSTLLCLDNFETPWEPFETRTKVEELLEAIADIPNLSLVITIRGGQRPSKVSWSKPLLPPLSTLSLDAAKMVVENIAGSKAIDDFTTQLLQAVDGIPLAITLVATLLRDGESSESLWARWSTDLTGSIRIGQDRQSNLDRSIALSVDSSRMTENSGTRYLLAVLSLLPDGLFIGVTLEDLQQHLGISSIRAILQILQKVALVQEDNTSIPPRIQMLSPIRLSCHQLLASEITYVLPKTVTYYVHLLNKTGIDRNNSVSCQTFVPEVKNIHFIFQQFFRITTVFPSQGLLEFVIAIDYLTWWSDYIGYYIKDTLHMALSRTINTPILRAQCLFSLGVLYKSEAAYASALKTFEEAAELFHLQKNFLLQATSLDHLGHTLQLMSQLDKAEETLKSSLDIYITDDDIRGQANAHSSLGMLYLERAQYSDAEKSLTRALEAYKHISHLLGQANTTVNLSRLYISLGNLDKAEEYANESLAISEEANFATAEGNALRILGEIYLHTDRIMDAGQSLEKALTIFKNLKNIFAQLFAASELGDVYIKMDQLSTAEALLVPYTRAEIDLMHCGFIFFNLGRLYICGDHLDTADRYLNTALQHFYKLKNKGWQANVVAHLAIMYLKSDRLDNAECALNFIRQLGTWRGVEMLRLWALGDFYIIKGQFDDAEKAFNSAMVRARDHQCSYQQGNIVRSLGSLHIKRGHVDRAIRGFKRAREFHRKAQWVSEQATDLKRLGEAYEMLDRSEEAEAAFKEADELMESVREARQLSI